MQVATILMGVTHALAIVDMQAVEFLAQVSAAIQSTIFFRIDTALE